MYNYSLHSSPYNFEIIKDNTYYNLTGLTEGNLNGFTFTDNNATSGGSYLTAQINGKYKLCMSLSFQSQAVGGTFGMGLARNFNISKSRDCYARREAHTDVGNIGVCCFMDLKGGDTVNMQIENEDSTRDLLIHTVNANIFRIGD